MLCNIFLFTDYCIWYQCLALFHGVSALYTTPILTLTVKNLDQVKNITASFAYTDSIVDDAFVCIDIREKVNEFTFLYEKSMQVCMDVLKV